MTNSCPLPWPGAMAEARMNLERSRIENPQRDITEAAILQALAYPGTNYFITTGLHWDCNCPRNYIRPQEMRTCEECGALREESADARINELKLHGIHVDLTDPGVIATLDQHNTLARR